MTQQGKYWLLDHLRVGCGKGLARASGFAPDARFTALRAVKPPREYYKGPLTFKQAAGASKWLTRVWA